MCHFRSSVRSELVENEVHHDGARGIGERGEESDRGDGDAAFFQQRRKPDVDAPARHQREQIIDRQQDHGGMHKDRRQWPCSFGIARSSAATSSPNAGVHPAAATQPGPAIGDQRQPYEGPDERRQCLDNKHLPPAEMLQQQAGDRTRDDRYSGTLIMNSVFAFARSLRVNQWRIRMITAVISPPSHSPTASRFSVSPTAPCTNAAERDAIPQAMAMKKISLRTLHVVASRAAGI